MGLEKSADQIKNTIECWYDFDEDLRENYREAIQWNIDNAFSLLKPFISDFNNRLYKALNIYCSYKKELHSIGISLPDNLCLKKENI